MGGSGALRPTCGSVAASFNRLRTNPSVRLGRGALDDIPVPAKTRRVDVPAFLSLLVIPAAPAAARAAVKSLPGTMAAPSPANALASGLFAVLFVWVAVRAAIRRHKLRKLEEPPELAGLRVSELAMFDKLHAEGDKDKVEEAWRELVARKKAEREKRLAAALAAAEAESKQLPDMTAPLPVPRSTAVKDAAAVVNGRRDYLHKPMPSMAHVTPEPTNGRSTPRPPFPPARAAARATPHPASSNTPSASAHPHSRALGAGALAQRIAAARATDGHARATGSSTPPSPVTHRSSHAADLRAADVRIAQARAQAAAAQPEAEDALVDHAAAERRSWGGGLLARMRGAARLLGALLARVAKLPLILASAARSSAEAAKKNQPSWPAPKVPKGSKAGAAKSDGDDGEGDADGVRTEWDLLAAKNAQLNALLQQRRAPVPTK